MGGLPQLRHNVGDGQVTKFLLWDWERRMWWKADKMGYTEDPAEAGRYTKEQAADVIIGETPAGQTVAVHLAEALRTGYLVQEFTHRR